VGRFRVHGSMFVVKQNASVSLPWLADESERRLSGTEYK